MSHTTRVRLIWGLVLAPWIVLLAFIIAGSI